MMADMDDMMEDEDTSERYVEDLIEGYIDDADAVEQFVGTTGEETTTDANERRDIMGQETTHAGEGASNDVDDDDKNSIFGGMARVKVYRLNERGHWDDKGTGFASCEYIEVGSKRARTCTETNRRASFAQQSNLVGLVVVSEEDSEPLLVHKISSQLDMYSRQEDETIISWIDTELNTDIALSFQEGLGCNFIWEQIKSVQRQYVSSGAGGLRDVGNPQKAAAMDMGGPELQHFAFQNDQGHHQLLGAGEQGTYLGMRELAIELPAPEMANLTELLKLITETSLFAREHIPKLLLKTKDYIKKLLELFRQCEDVDDIEGLHSLYAIFRGFVMLNDADLYETLLSTEFVFDFVGVLEYDPEQSERTQHREFLRDKVKFKEVVTIANPAIREKIHQTCRLGYLKDVILPRVLDDSAFSMLTSMMMYNNVEVVQALHRDPKFFGELFKRLKSSKAGDEDWNDLVGFLQELCTLARHLQNNQRLAVFASLQDHGLFDVLTDILTHGDEYSQLKAADVIMSSLQNDPAVLRDFLVRQQTENASNNMLSELVRLFLIGSDGMQATYLEILLFLMDPDTMNSQSPEKDELLNIFYDKHMGSIVKRVASGKENVTTGAVTSEDTVPAWALTKMIDLLIFFVQHHSYRIKYYILRNHVLQHVLNLTERKEKYVVVAAIRFLRACVQLKDEFYNRYLIKINAFSPVIKVFKLNGDRYNLLNSSVLELIDFVRRENIRNLIQHLVTQYESVFEEVYYVDTFRLLKLRYQQALNNAAPGSDFATTSQGYAGREIAGAQALAEQRLRRDSSMSKDEEDYFENDDEREPELTSEHVPHSSAIHSPPGPPILHFQGSRFVPHPIAHSVFSDEVDTGPTHGELGKRGRSTSPPPMPKHADLPLSPDAAETVKKPKAIAEESLTAAQRNAHDVQLERREEKTDASVANVTVKQTANPTSTWVTVDEPSENVDNDAKDK